VDPYAAVDPIVADIRKHRQLKGATIAVERKDGFEVLYPKDFQGEFRYWYED
jgi:hypothetical protein